MTYTVDTNDIATTGRGADVNEEHLSLLDAVNLVSRGVTACANNSLQNGGFYINFNVHLRHASRVTDDASNHVVGAGKLRVNLSSHSDKTAWNGIHQLVVVGHQSNDNRLNLSPRRLARLLALSDLSRANRNLVAHFEATLEDSSSCNTTLEGLSIFSWLVHIERTDDNHVWGNRELA